MKSMKKWKLIPLMALCLIMIASIAFGCSDFFKTQPKNTTIAANKDGTVSVELSKADDKATYEWQVKDGDNWKKIETVANKYTVENATTKDLKITNNLGNTETKDVPLEVRCKVVDKNSKEHDSKSATVTLSKPAATT